MAAEMLNDNSFYVSAPTSPRGLSLENMCFYSVPPSPARKSFEYSYDIPETEPTTPRDEGYEDANTSFIEFEFETSRRFNVEDGEDHESDDYAEAGNRNFEYPRKQPQHQLRQSLPTMAFADELFCDGKVMPLKPPPRFHCNNESSNISGLSSPKSPVRKFPFPRQSLWNDDVDPFVAALENVREENRDKIHRRAGSMSSLRAISSQNLDKRQETKESEQKQHQNGQNLKLKEANENSSDYSIWVPNNNVQKGCRETVWKSPIRLADPKGVLFARRARLEKMGHEKPSKKKLSKGESGTEREESCIKESKRKKVKKFLLRSASMGKTSSEEKAKEESEALPKQSFTRKFSLRSKGLAQYNEEKRASEVATITLMQHRPNLFLCMGYGKNFV